MVPCAEPMKPSCATSKKRDVAYSRCSHFPLLSLPPRDRTREQRREQTLPRPTPSLRARRLVEAQRRRRPGDHVLDIHHFQPINVKDRPGVRATRPGRHGRNPTSPGRGLGRRPRRGDGRSGGRRRRRRRRRAASRRRLVVAVVDLHVQGAVAPPRGRRRGVPGPWFRVRVEVEMQLGGAAAGRLPLLLLLRRPRHCAGLPWTACGPVPEGQVSTRPGASWRGCRSGLPSARARENRGRCGA
jgi:hypothetical protein